MRPIIYILVIFATSALPAQANEKPVLSLENLITGDVFHQAIVKLDNSKGPAYTLIEIECAYFKDGKAIDVESTTMQNIQAGQIAYGKTMASHRGSTPDEARCRISETRK